MQMTGDKNPTERTAVVGVSVPDAPLSTKIIRSVLSGGLRYFLVAPIPFVMTPLILKKIGVGGYGTWAVFLAINALTSLADLGLVGTLSKFIADYHARRDFVALGKALNSGLSLFFLLAIAINVALAAAAVPLSSWFFHGSTVAQAEIVRLFRLFLIVIGTNIINLLLSSVTTGLQRLDLTNMISAGNVFLSALFSALLLLNGWGLRGLVYGYIASGVLTVIAYVITIRRLLPQVAINPVEFDRAEARKLFSFSSRFYVTQAAVAVHTQIEKVFLAALVGVAAVGWYDIASDVSLKVRGAIGFVLSPVLPAASELNALGDERRMKELYYRTHKYLALIGVPAVCLMAAAASRFVQLWIGNGLSMVAFPLSVLVVINFLNLTTGPGFLIFAGRGYLKPGVNSAILGVLVNVPLSLGLIYRFGFSGAVLGTSVSLFVASAYFIYVFHRETRYSFVRLIGESYIKPISISVITLLGLLAIRPITGLSWFGLAELTMAFGISYSVLILLSRFFDEYDWRKFEQFLPLTRRVRRLCVWGEASAAD